MFARVKKSGKYQYLQIVHNERVGKKVCQRTIANLGRLDILQASGQLDAAVASLANYALHTAVLAERRQRQTAAADLRHVGGEMVFGRLWKELGIDAVLNRLLAGRGFEFPVERTVFSTVLHRLFVSGSDRSADHWFRTRAVPGLEGIDLHHRYRAMGWLGEVLPAGEQAGATPFSPRCVKDAVEEHLFERRRDLFTDLEMVFFDTTSLYVEGAGGRMIGRHGKSKDHRPDLPRMVVGMVLDGDGRPLCCEMWPGNTTDVTTLLPIIRRLRKRFGVSRVCIVADRGMISAPTMAELQCEELDCRFILGVRMRNCKEAAEKVLSRAGRYHVVNGPRERSDDPSPLKVKEVWDDDHRYIVCRNEEQARKDAADREAILENLRKSLKSGDKSLIGNKGYRRYIKRPDGPRFAVDAAKIRSEARLDGKWVLRTDTDLSATEVALKYKELWMVERIFRDLKSQLDTRPIFHQLDATIRGHVFCSFLALVLAKELTDRLASRGDTDVEWKPMLEELDDVQRFTVAASGKRFELRTDLGPNAAKAFRAAGVAPGAAIHQLD